MTEGEGKGETVRGIYEFKDDTRKVCLADRGQERPTEFSSTAGGGHILAVLKRVCEDMPRSIGEVNPELPPWLGDLLTRLHAKAPADRFASAREVADLLARHLAELQHVGPGLLPA